MGLSVGRNLNHKPPKVTSHGAPKWHVTLLIYKVPSFRGILGQVPQSEDICGSPSPKVSHRIALLNHWKAGRFLTAPSELGMEHSLYSPILYKNFNPRVLSTISPRRFFYLSGPRSWEVRQIIMQTLFWVACKNIWELLTQLPSPPPTLPHTHLQNTWRTSRAFLLFSTLFQSIVTIKACVACIWKPLSQ